MIRKAKSINGLWYAEWTPKVWNGHTILFLHGHGERDTDENIKLKSDAGQTFKAEVLGLANQLRTGLVDNNFRYVIPQLSTRFGGWGSNQIDDMKEVMDVYSSKENHITGISMGGIGTLSALKRHPGFFRTAGICCGSSSTSYMENLVPTKIKAWHGDKDTVVGIGAIREITKRQNALGNPMRLIEYPGAGHNIWDRVYNLTDPESYWAFINAHVNEQPVEREAVISTTIVNGTEVHFETSKGVYKASVTKL